MSSLFKAVINAVPVDINEIVEDGQLSCAALAFLACPPSCRLAAAIWLGFGDGSRI